jgi:hypothetical protein
VPRAARFAAEDERDRSNTERVLCGSLVQQMEALMDEGSALRGRLTSLRGNPFAFGEVGELIEDAALDPARARRPGRLSVRYRSAFVPRGGSSARCTADKPLSGVAAERLLTGAISVRRR